MTMQISHNPYFNRWFSAIEQSVIKKEDKTVTILILIDGFLQYYGFISNTIRFKLSQSLF